MFVDTIEVQHLLLKFSFLKRIKRSIQYTNPLNETVQMKGTVGKAWLVYYLHCGDLNIYTIFIHCVQTLRKIPCFFIHWITHYTKTIDKEKISVVTQQMIVDPPKLFGLLHVCDRK